MRYRIVFTLLILALIKFSPAGDSQLGLVDRSFGLLHVSYSTAGFSRGFEVADDDSLHINYQNYSFWANVAYTTYQVDANYRSSLSEDRSATITKTDRAGFQGGFMTIPLFQRKLAFGLGLHPLTEFEYPVKHVIDSTTTEYLLTKGGLSSAMFNLAYRPFDWIGLAFTYEYNFGKISDSYRMEFGGLESNLITFEYEYRLYGNSYSFSANLQPFTWLSLGAMYKSAINFDSDFELKTGTNIDSQTDKVNKTFRFPEQFNAGLIVKLGERYRSGIDFIYQDWENGYKINDEVIPRHSKFYRISAGIERTAGKRLFSGYTDAMDFRLGLFYGNQNLKSALENIPEYGLSLGFSLPLQRFISKMDIGALAGKRGDLNSNYYEDFFFKIGISITSNERWFVKTEN